MTKRQKHSAVNFITPIHIGSLGSLSENPEKQKAHIRHKKPIGLADGLARLNVQKISDIREIDKQIIIDASFYQIAKGMISRIF